MSKFFSFEFFVVFLITLCTACSDGNGDHTQREALNLSGTIMFDQAHTVYYAEHYGIMMYDLDNHSMKTFIAGKHAHKNKKHGLTAFLQECYAPAGIGPLYRVALADSVGRITPVSVCSDEIPNPSLSSRTHFVAVRLSPDESKIATTVQYYDSGYKNYIIVYDLHGTRLNTFDRAYNPAWLPNGRLLYVFSNTFYLSDASLSHATAIDDHNQINGPVNHPAIHPSGAYFIFEYNLQIWRMNLDGSGVEGVVYGARKLRWPSWSPDGRVFVFTQWDSDNSFPDEVFYFFDIETKKQKNVNISRFLQISGEPWGPLNWIK